METRFVSSRWKLKSGKKMIIFDLDYYWEPLLDEEKHFCGFECLKKWMEKEEL